MEEYRIVPGSELSARIERFKSSLANESIDVSLILYGPDLFYFTGIIQQGILAILPDREPIYFVRRHFRRAQEESPLSEIHSIESPSDMKDHLGEIMERPLKIGFELDVLPVNLFNRLKGLFPNMRAQVDISPLIRNVRSVKSPLEIASMRLSGEKLVSLMNKAGNIIKSGEKEIDIFSRIVGAAMAGGNTSPVKMRSWNQQLSFGHILSGESACVPTYTDTPIGGKGKDPSFPRGSGENRVEEKEPVIVDMMWIHGGYGTDMTRIFSVGGIEDEEVARAHGAAIEIMDRARSMCRPGASSRNIFLEAREIAKEAGFLANFMGPPGNNVKFLGHGVGIEIDEYPFFTGNIDFILEKGNTFALEPKFVLPGKGVVGVENTFLVTEDGVENLTQMDEEIIVI